jgi:protein involved in polysaccharide export with SLBB domain
MARLRSVLALLVLTLVSCTSSRPPPPRNLPPPVPSTTLGQSDVIDVQVLGEELPKTYKVRADGTIDFPYVGRINAGGLEPQELADIIKKKLVEAKILTNPQLLVNVTEYNSKHVSVIGQVTKPGAVKYFEGMKLIDALTESGWFTSVADSNHVLLTREVSATRLVTAVVSVDAITDGQQQDIPLQVGDTIKVESRVF